MKKLDKLLCGAFLALTVFDMGVKQYVEDELQKGEEKEAMIPNMVIRKVHNKGFAFNLLDKYPKVIKGCSLFLAIGITAYDVWLYFQKGRFFEKLSMLFISAGAVSNIYDRLIREHVVDYIGLKTKWEKVNTTTVNLADVYVLLGTVLYSVTKLFKKNK